MRRSLLGLLFAWPWLTSAAAAAPVLPFDDVQVGMKGTGRTVFSGTDVESFDVEILAKLPNVGPDQNLILARLSGGPLAETGVLAGMSGSPVFVGDRLVGAVAYSWGFSTEAIAGVTPIEEMLAVAELHEGGGMRAAALAPAGDELERLRSREPFDSFFDELFAVVGRGALAPVALPLAVSGIGPDGLARLVPELRRVGFQPLQSGGAGDAAEPAAPLEPGSAMGLKLVRGDLDMTATGTVTWVEGDRLIGLGHPLFGLGSVDLPMTGARVQALLPNLRQSARIATPQAEIGALRQDRAAGVLGLVGASPRMIPVRLQLTGGAVADHEFSFDIADDPLLSPLLLYMSLNGVLASKERAFGTATVRLRQGSVIKLLDGPDVELDNLFAGPAAFDYGTGIAAYILYLLMNNTWTQPQIVGVNLLLDFEDTPRTARIRRAAIDRYRVAAGESVEVTVVLSPYRGPDQKVTREIQVPPETRPGKITLAIGGALAIGRTVDHEEPLLPRDLDQLIWLINQLRRNDRIYILATHDDAGVLLGGARLPNLPPSVASVLTRPRSSGNYSYIPQRSILEEIVPTEYAVEGAARIQLEVEPR